MPEIRFTIDGTEQAIQVDTIDPNELYSSGDRIVELVENSGYSFKSGEEPDRGELSIAGRDSSGSDIDLGDITDRVTPAAGDSDGGITEDDESESDDSNVEGEVAITLIGPNGNEESKTVGESQNLGAITSAINLTHDDVGMSETVVLYRSEKRNEEISRGEMAKEYDGETLFWSTEPI